MNVLSISKEIGSMSAQNFHSNVSTMHLCFFLISCIVLYVLDKSGCINQNKDYYQETN